MLYRVRVPGLDVLCVPQCFWAGWVSGWGRFYNGANDYMTTSDMAYYSIFKVCFPFPSTPPHDSDIHAMWLVSHIYLVKCSALCRFLTQNLFDCESFFFSLHFHIVVAVVVVELSRIQQQMDFRCYCLSWLRNSYKFVIKFICWLVIKCNQSIPQTAKWKRELENSQWKLSLEKRCKNWHSPFFLRCHRNRPAFMQFSASSFRWDYHDYWL